MSIFWTHANTTYIIVKPRDGGRTVIKSINISSHVCSKIGKDCNLWSLDMVLNGHFPASDVLTTRTRDRNMYDTASDATSWIGYDLCYQTCDKNMTVEWRNREDTYWRRTHMWRDNRKEWRKKKKKLLLKKEKKKKRNEHKIASYYVMFLGPFIYLFIFK